MTDLPTERRHLAKAERDVADGKARIMRQADLVGRLRAEGRDVAQAEALLSTMRQSLEAWQDHREEILRTIARLESAPGEPVPVAPPTN
ncbi:hypothetical protein ACE7GA_22185 [Roseomonas sp. CCTCC AB2023176]|uniref:hypothetical protein n=1 Tax=Roseomonas sp. CCTCC AB2023176 TaxID=3342640 RepID=UPI0035DC1F4A